MVNRCEKTGRQVRDLNTAGAAKIGGFRLWRGVALLLGGALFPGLLLIVMQSPAQEQVQAKRQEAAGPEEAVWPASPTLAEPGDAGPPEIPDAEPGQSQDTGQIPAQHNEGALQSEQTLWYRSNQLGMALELLEDPRQISVLEWGLEVESGALERLKTLYFQGQLQETWLLTYRGGKPFQEQHRRGEQLLETRFFNETNGLVSEINSYTAESGQPSERYLFFYNEDGDLERSIRYDSLGQLDRESSYQLGEGGQLIKFKVRLQSKNRDLIQYRLPGIETFARRLSDNSGDYQVRLFDEKRQNTSQIIYRDNVVSRRSNFQYNAAGKLEKSIVTEDQKVTEYDYDEQEALLQKQIWQSGSLMETEIYSYDAQGRLLTKQTTDQKNNQNREERYSYQGQSSDPLQVEFYLNGAVDRIRSYSDPYNYSEELYLNGNSVAKVYYSYGDQLSSEVTFQNVSDPEAFDQVFNDEPD